MRTRPGRDGQTSPLQTGLTRGGPAGHPGPSLRPAPVVLWCPGVTWQECPSGTARHRSRLCSLRSHPRLPASPREWPLPVFRPAVGLPGKPDLPQHGGQEEAPTVTPQLPETWQWAPCAPVLAQVSPALVFWDPVACESGLGGWGDATELWRGGQSSQETPPTRPHCPQLPCPLPGLCGCRMVALLLA